MTSRASTRYDTTVRSLPTAWRTNHVRNRVYSSTASISAVATDASDAISVKTAPMASPTGPREVPALERYMEGQRDRYTSMAMMQCARDKEGREALGHLLRLLRKDGMLPSREALFQVTHVLYKQRDLGGMSALHAALYSFYHTNYLATKRPLAARQAQFLTHMYAMLIQLLVDSQRRTSTQFRGMSSMEHVAKQLEKTLPSDLGNQSTRQQRAFHRRQWLEWQQQQENKHGEIIVRLCQEMRQLGLRGSSPLYNTLLRWSTHKQRDSSLAWALFAELQQWCTPTERTYTILLHFARTRRDYPAMLRVLRNMRKHTIVPDHTMVSIIMLTLCDRANYTKAMQFLNGVRDANPHLLTPTQHAHLVHLLCKHHQQRARQQAAAVAFLPASSSLNRDS
ncbi:hypothetical protein BC940DRAFT_317099 [Gongronella butleri]|nr:hypothetical protein BC940DRAFT_317099 [Gongronella butleri]